MDPVKKLVADRLTAQVASPHPDAEVLSAFAENALPPSERETILQHLSTCSNCRDVLFLAAPTQPEPQQAVAAPRARPFFALRWGTLAACALIAAVFLVSRHESPKTQQLAKSAPQAVNAISSYSSDPAIAAADKMPADLAEMRAKLPDKIVVPPPTSAGHAEPKHITAKPEGGMSFADSGEVRLKSSQIVADRTLPSVAQALPPDVQNAINSKQKAPTTVPSTNQARGAAGGVIVQNGSWSPQAVANAPVRKDLAAYGNVAGTVLDVSGAVVPNVRVTAISPLGTQTATSDQAGKYAFNQLQAGNYQLNFDAPGFRQVQYQQVAVLANQQANMDVKLQPGSTSETVEVSASAAAPVDAHADAALQIQQQNVNAMQTGRAQAELSSIQTVEVKEKKRSGRAAPTPAMAKAAALLLWSLSPEGLVQRSADQGATWEVVRLAKGLTFHAISSFENHVWVGSSAGVLYHSADTGRHWARVVPATGEGRMQGDVTQIQFADPEHGTITTSNGEVWATADGGHTWTRQ